MARVAKILSRKTSSRKTAGGSTLRKKPAKGSSRTPKPQQKPIDLYFWPTPNGHKISIMLEECRLPYRVVPLNISRGDQFSPEFLAISPNNRMPVIVDPDGPGGKPISIFESGAILQYLGRKTAKFYPGNERLRVEVDQWLFWQMANLGPKAGECHHFRQYAPERIGYSTDRFTNEMNRLYGVMNRRLADRDFLAGPYSIADMACVSWARRWERQGQNIGDFPNVERWLERMLARPAVHRGMHIWVEEASRVDIRDPKVRATLFNQRAR